jgi:hypothetical protein
MRSQVTVTWGGVQTFRIDLEDQPALSPAEARAWLDEQFIALGCEPIRLTGKVLTADKIVGVAQAAGPAWFAEAVHQAWATRFARAASAALDKAVVTVDLDTRTIGY